MIQKTNIFAGTAEDIRHSRASRKHFSFATFVPVLPSRDAFIPQSETQIRRRDCSAVIEEANTLPALAEPQRPSRSLQIPHKPEPKGNLPAQVRPHYLPICLRVAHRSHTGRTRALSGTPHEEAPLSLNAAAGKGRPGLYLMVRIRPLARIIEFFSGKLHRDSRLRTLCT